MTFLSKLGAIILKSVQVLTAIEPLATAYAPKSPQVLDMAENDLTKIGAVIMQVEVMGQALALPGPQKLIAAAPSVAQVILQSTLLAGHKIANPTLFAAGAAKMADGMADVLNSLKDDVGTADKT